MALPEADSAWFWDLKETLEENKNNPHFDLEDAIIKKVNRCNSERVHRYCLFITARPIKMNLNV